MSSEESPGPVTGVTVEQPPPASVPSAPEAGGGTRSEGSGHPVSITGWFLHQVRTRADLPAMYARGEEGWIATSWGDLGAAARSFAALLISEGVSEAGHVAVWSANRPEFHIADAATLLARAVPVPVYTTFSPGQAAYVIQHSESRVLVIENTAVLERLLSVRDRVPGLRRVVVMEGLETATSDGFVLPWGEALERGASQRTAAPEIERRVSAIDLDDTATLIYTSGTTGPPKAVQLSHRNLLAAESALTLTFPVTSDERVLSYLPLAHVVERLVSELLSFRQGNPVWFLDGIDNLGPRLREVRPTIFFGVPRVWEKMERRVEDDVAAITGMQGRIARWGLRVALTAERRAAAGRRLPAALAWQRSLADRLVLGKVRERTGLDRARHLVSGAAPIAEETLRFFHAIGLPVVEGYGQSENAAIATMNPPGDARVGSVGRPSEQVEIRIADDGEVLMRGPTVFPGYFKDEAATREVIDAEGWLHTGDLGQLDERGYLRITGRKKDLIITAGGKNIAPSGIEEQLAANRLVGHAVCVGDRRSYIAALLTPDPEEAARWAAARHLDADLQALVRTEELRAEMGRWIETVNANLSRPEQVKRWTLLPRDFEVGRELTPTLKVKRSTVAELYAEEIEALYR